MKIKLAAKTVEACDICERQYAGSLLTKCIICKKEYCHCCEAIMCGCIHQPQICKKCGDNEKVRATVDRFADPIVAVLRKRDTALRRHAKSITPSASPTTPDTSAPNPQTPTPE